MSSAQLVHIAVEKPCPEDWQTTKLTIKDRCSFLFNNELLSDIKFIVPVPSGESESIKKSKHEIFAHKFLLSISSPVFYTMFYGAIPEASDTVELPDCGYESLVEFLRFIYSDEVILSESNVTEVLYLSKKYMMPPLADKCWEFLASNMYPSNVFSVLSVAELHEEEKVVNLCWKMIDEQTRAVLRQRIERRQVEAIVTRDTLKIKEVELFTALNLWATSECEKNGLTADGKTKRTVLGEQIIKAIRFPVMSQAMFNYQVEKCDILSSEEVSHLRKYFEKTLDGPLAFPDHRRLLPHNLVRRQRFRECGQSFSYDRGWKDSIVFEVIYAIQLYGTRFFGRANSNYSVKLELINEKSEEVLLSKKSNFTAVPLKTYSEDAYDGFEFLFDSPVDIGTNAKYRMEALISGPPSEKGKRCYRETDWFIFSRSRRSAHENGTNEHGGQFSEFVFVRKYP